MAGVEQVNADRRQFSAPIHEKPESNTDSGRGELGLADERCRFDALGAMDPLHALTGRRKTGMRPGGRGRRMPVGEREPEGSPGGTSDVEV